MNRIKLSDIKWLLVLLCLPFVSSCKDDLEAYEEAEITSVGAYHRYYTTEKDALTGEFKVAEKELEKSNSINEDEAVVTATFTVPAASGSFTDAERAKVSLNKLVVYFNVSTAARVTPLDGSPKLGAPGDWTSERRYSVIYLFSDKAAAHSGSRNPTKILSEAISKGRFTNIPSVESTRISSSRGAVRTFSFKLSAL